QDLGAFAEKIRACLQKAERRTAFTRSFTPVAIPGTQKGEKKRVAPVLALAAAIVVLAVLGAFFLPQRFANRERKPLGVMIGVPETTGEPSQASISESSGTPSSSVVAAVSAASPLNQAPDPSAAIAQQSPASPPDPGIPPGGMPAAKAENQSAQ